MVQLHGLQHVWEKKNYTANQTEKRPAKRWGKNIDVKGMASGYFDIVAFRTREKSPFFSYFACKTSSK